MRGNKHAYFGAFMMDQFERKDRRIFAYTYGGAINIWNKDLAGDGNYTQSQTTKGHFGEVTDLDWNADKTCLVSCSSDQTTRCLTQVGEKGENDLYLQYQEIARP